MILRPSQSGRSMQRQERSSGTQIMNATQTTAFPAVSSPRSPVAKTAFPITYMSQSPRLPTTLPAFLPALRNPMAPKPGKTPLPTPGLHRSASTTKTEPAKSSTATAPAMSVSSMAKQENLMIPCPSATASSKPPLRYMIIWRLLVRGTARSGGLSYSKTERCKKATSLGYILIFQ